MNPENSFCEISVKISNDEQSFTQKFACYENVTVSCHDPILKQYVAEAKESFKGPTESCTIKIKMVWE